MYSHVPNPRIQPAPEASRRFPASLLLLILAISGLTVPGLAQEFGSATTTRVQNRGFQFRFFALGDFDNDGDRDVGILSAQDICFYRRGAGLELLPERTISHGGLAQVFDTGDIDGDGNVDLFVGGSGPNTIYFGDGDFGFTPFVPDEWISEYAFTADAVLADITGDGLPEIFEANDLAPNRAWHLQPLGAFIDLLAGVPQGDDRTQSVDVSEPDANGSYWVAYSNLGNLDVRMEFSLGAFHDRSDRFPEDAGLSQDSAWTDVDRDGYWDLLTLYADRAPILFNHGATGFTPSADPYWVSLSSKRRVAVGDLDGDKDDDFAFFSDNERPSFAKNDGSGFFSPGFGVLFTSLNPLVPQTVDWDDNDTLDLIAGDQNAIYIAHNRSFYFSASPTAEIGSEIRFEQWGRANEDRNTIVFGSFSLEPSPIISPFGPIYLQGLTPLSNILVTRFSSRGDASMAIPGLPRIVGTRVYSQGAYFNQDLTVVRATNLQMTEIILW